MEKSCEMESHSGDNYAVVKVTTLVGLTLFHQIQAKSVESIAVI